MTPAVTIIHTHGGGAVQIAGLDTPLEQQVEALQEMGRLNAPGVPGALRGEVWTTGARVAASTFFECSPVEPVAAAEPSPENTPSQETVPGTGETHNLEQAGSTPAPATNHTPTDKMGAGAPETPAPESSPPDSKKPPGRLTK